MSDANVARLRMFAGPNGSGKTTLVRTLAREYSPLGAFSVHTYVNADDIQAALISPQGLSLESFGINISLVELTDRMLAIGRLTSDTILTSKLWLSEGRLKLPSSESSSYIAAGIADVVRDDLLERRESMTFETVMSHPSKVDFLALARDKGYRTYLYFVATASPRLNVKRVRNRHITGGHDVPSIKISQRYERSLQLLSNALRNVERGYVFDNSGEEIQLLSEVHPDRRIELKVPHGELPNWYLRYMPASL